VRAGYLVVSWFFFTVMLALMVWRIAGDNVSWLMFFPALLAGFIGLAFAGAARSEGRESHERSE
jgi:hypothetical protein